MSANREIHAAFSCTSILVSNSSQFLFRSHLPPNLSVEAADKSFVDLGRDFERARAKLGQLRTSFDGRSVIDDVVCLQHVAKLLSTELEAAISGHRETAAQLSDWRTRHATKVRSRIRIRNTLERGDSQKLTFCCRIIIKLLHRNLDLSVVRIDSCFYFYIPTCRPRSTRSWRECTRT